MIAKKIKNPSKSATKTARIRGLVDYIRAPQREYGAEKCIYAGTRGFLSHTPEGQKAEMIALAEEAVRSKDPICHYVLSWHEGETPTPAQVDEAVSLFLDELGLTDHQVIYGLHDDTDNRHCHIAVNRVHPDTLRVIKPNQGFDIEAAHRAIARIERTQGWRKEHNALYDVSADGQVVKRARDHGRERQPTAEKQSREHWTGEQSAERIAITEAGPIIKSAKTWQQLHQALAKVGMRYERKGSGALVYVGDVALKASNVDRKASLAAMQRRLGPFEPSSQEKPNEYFSHQAKPYARHLGQGTGDRMRNLSECRLASLGVDKKGSGVLLVDARSSRRSSDRLRRRSDRRGTCSTGQAARALKANQPAWSEYIAARDAHKVRKKSAFEITKDRHKVEWEQLTKRLKIDRTAALAGDWGGRGAQRNARASVIAIQQAAAKAELREQQDAERKALKERFKPLPSYPEWKAAPAITGIIVLDEEEEKRTRYAQEHVRKLSTTLRQLQYEQNREGHVTYRSAGVNLFRDEGRRLAVLDPNSDEAIAVALAVAQQKFGKTLTLTGNADFQKRVAAVAVAKGMSIVFADPAMEEYRQRLKLNRVSAAKPAKPFTAAEKWAQFRQEHQPFPPPISATVVASFPAPAGEPLPEELLQQKNAPINLLQPASDVAQLLPIPTHVATAADARAMHEEDKVMATMQDHELVNQAAARRDADPRYLPTAAELKAIDQVLIEQTRERLDFEKRWQGLAEANNTHIKHGIVIEVCGNRAVYKAGHDHFIGPAPITKEVSVGQERGPGR